MTGNRNALRHQIEAALARPQLVVPYLRRRARNALLRLRSGSHPEFYRAVMADDVVRKGARGAVGTPSHDRWMALGELQFDYLSGHGLLPQHRLLEIGCGNLRAGWRFIRYLEPGHYTGVDISPDILLAAQRTIVEHGLQDREPALYLVNGSDLSFLPPSRYDVVHAHSVFSHTPLNVIEAYLREVHRLLRPGGFFDFTYNASDEGPWSFLDEDFYYPTEFLLGVARSQGLDARPLVDWDYKQQKIRAIKPVAGAA